jgi:hypothetical protein
MYFVVKVDHQTSDFKNDLKFFNCFGDLVNASYQEQGYLFGYKIKLEFNIPEFSSDDLGSFAELKINHDSLSLNTDFQGLEPVFYFTNSKLSCVSNSFILLYESLLSFGEQLSFDSNQINLYSADGQISQQLASFRTIVNQIYLLRSGYNLRINKDKLLLIEKPDYIDKSIGYNRAILMGALQTSAIIRSLPQYSSKSVLNLSGGVDSRAVLAACLYSYRAEFDNLFSINTSLAVEHSNDALIAGKICDGLNLQLNKGSDNRKYYALTPDLALKRFNLSNNFVYFSSNISQNYYDEDRLSLRGGQANNVVYEDLISFSNRIATTTGIHVDWITNFIREATNYNGDDTYEIMYQHYIQYRFRIHYGRTSSTKTEWSTCIDPLINPYVNLSAFLLNKNERDLGKNSFDITCALMPSLLNYEFNSKAQKSLNQLLKMSSYYPVGIGGMSNISFTSDFSSNDFNVINKINYPILSDFNSLVFDQMIDFVLSKPVSVFDEFPLFSDLRKFLNSNSGVSIYHSNKLLFNKLFFISRFLN